VLPSCEKSDNALVWARLGFTKVQTQQAMGKINCWKRTIQICVWSMVAKSTLGCAGCPWRTILVPGNKSSTIMNRYWKSVPKWKIFHA